MTRSPLVLIAALAAVCVLPATGSAATVGLSSGPSAVAAASTASSSRTVSVRVRWNSELLSRAGTRDRGTVSLTALEPKGRPLTIRRSVRTKIRKSTELVVLRLTASQASRMRRAYRVVLTVTQQYDSSTDSDSAYEVNRVFVDHFRGRINRYAGRSCKQLLTSGVDASRCDLRGADLYGADLSGVNLAYADLSGARLSRAKLASAVLTGTRLDGAKLGGATMPAADQAALTMPADGQKVVDAIDAAQQSVDIVIYDFGGPNIVGEPSKPGALMRAVARGVNVRVMFNASTQDTNCLGLDPTHQAVCAWNGKLDGLYATQASLKYAAANAPEGVTPGKYRIQLSSQNFQITHQKSVLIDTSNSNGEALTAGNLLPSSKIIVSTGNLGSYGWGQRSGYSSTLKQKVVVNQNYRTNPQDSCVAVTSAACALEWAARDFAIVVTDPALVERIASVFASDQRCDGIDVNNSLLTSTLADTWANGTLLADNSGDYPVPGAPSFYGAGQNTLLQTSPQGNARERMLNLINSAQKGQDLVVYNEEMVDPDVAGTRDPTTGKISGGALVAAAKRGADVRVVMAASMYNGKIDTSKYSKNPLAQWDNLVSNGVQVRVLPNTAGELYIHGKAIIVNNTDGFMGSENFGFESINYNRELGLMISNRADLSGAPEPSIGSIAGIQQITTAFEADWADPQSIAYTVQGATAAAPSPAGAFPEYPMACLAPQGGDLYQPNLPTRTPLPPASEQPAS
ncbi:MAG: hypothetical protein F2813_02000 [Actinobacteria bacterium]|uniref:Unannotated protein n=1 Tax=freshwater metagenome TaxID=449393 RepID=A0A6J5Z948_9ZZZZ|nr:hypothetical protein [Actinomycetota bacterium]